jgi:hypothetical protein
LDCLERTHDWIKLLPTGKEMKISGVFVVATWESTIERGFDFTRLPLAAAIAYLLFSQLPDAWWTMVGAAVIFSATLYVTLREGRAKGTSTARRPGPA